MKITVDNAVVIRFEDVRESFHLKVHFADLTEDAQNRIFASNKNTFLCEALNSPYLSVLESATEVLRIKGSFDFDSLNSKVKKILEKGDTKNYHIVSIILESPDFKPDIETYKLLKMSDHFSTWAKNYYLK